MLIIDKCLPTEYKFSIPGLMFFLILIFFYHLFGGDLEGVFERTKDKNVLALLALIFSTPVVGVIFSTITAAVLQLFRGYKLWYFPPESLSIIEYTLTGRPDLKEKILKRATPYWTDKKIVKEYYPYYQAKVGELLQGEQISFLDRRWSAYWIHVNNIGMILISFLIVVAIRLFSRGHHWGIFQPTTFQVVGFLTIVFYCISAYNNLTNSKKDATKVEHLMLENAISTESKKNDYK